MAGCRGGRYEALSPSKSSRKYTQKGNGRERKGEVTPPEYSVWYKDHASALCSFEQLTRIPCHPGPRLPQRWGLYDRIRWTPLATSTRLTSKHSQPDLFELSTETGQDQNFRFGLKADVRKVEASNGSGSNPAVSSAFNHVRFRTNFGRKFVESRHRRSHVCCWG